MADEKKAPEFKKDNKPAGEGKPAKPDAPGAGGNDSSGLDPKLVEYAAKISFFTRSGSRFYKGQSIPGIMVLDWVPTLGVAHDVSDPVNMAADIAYREVRHANSGARNYAPADLLLIDMSVDSLVSLWFEFYRAYGLVMKYSSVNEYYGRALLSALGYNYDDLVANMPNFKYTLDYLGSRLNKIAHIPVFDYHARHRTLASNVYKDGDSERAQLYVFRQTHYYYYDLADQAKGVSLLSREVFSGPNGMGYAGMVEMINTMLTALLESEDFALITGDIQKCWGDNSFLKLPAVPDAAVLEFVKFDSILEAIMNLTAVGEIDVPSFTLRDNQGHFTYDPRIVMLPWNTAVGTYNPALFYNGEIINMVTEDPAAKDIVNAVCFNTRVDFTTPTYNDSDPSKATAMSFPLTAFGTEVATNIRLIFMDEDGYVAGRGNEMCANTSFNYLTGEITGSETEADGTTFNPIRASAMLAQFDWHPPVTFCPVYTAKFQDVASFRNRLPMVDLNVYTNVDTEVIRKIHEARLLSGFNI